ncbi:phospholipase [Halorubrum sp. Atlit-8R]|uniref:alpha/beta hydrolase n=1 Tax=unclassified Halorubrum TaxID=2642239 RepID=UPI000EF22131|nr:MULTISPECIES: dienelactone hydrolase family protein [unclassified Halorubrum]RLM67269.1 phospholipase [Halorubrum sp. Atlit-9R]RLM77429.1 phospholipase [Halorubrum sp. Atlit-8R]
MSGRGPSPHAGDDPHGDEPLVTAGASLDDAAAALVLVHGRGATARSVVDLGEQLAGDREVAILAPAAAGNTWYPNSFLAPVADNEPGRSSGLRAVGAAVDRAVDAGIARDRVLVGGFSQGACLASEFVARNPTRYGGLAVFSGGLIGETVAVEDYLPDGETSADGDGPLAGTPAFVGCSDVDPHIPEERVHETTDVLEALGADVDERIYEGMGHGINDEEVAAVSELVASLA